MDIVEALVRCFVNSQHLHCIVKMHVRVQTMNFSFASKDLLQFQCRLSRLFSKILETLIDYGGVIKIARFLCLFNGSICARNY